MKPVKMERVEGERLKMRADAHRVEGRRGRSGKGGLRWEDCFKRDVAGVRGEWRTTARNREGGVETNGGQGGETESATKKKRKQQSTTRMYVRVVYMNNGELCAV